MNVLRSFDINKPGSSIENLKVGDLSSPLPYITNEGNNAFRIILLKSKSEPHKGWTGGLGVIKEYRRKGIATALKIKAIEHLLKKGIVEIRTDNEKNNPMYKINVALGFQPVPFSLDYSKNI